MMIVYLLSGACLFGLLLLVLGMRGKCIDDHPLCRKCKYDLVGTEQLPANCPECGAKLSKHRATRIGNRKRRRAMLAVGIFIFATSLTTGGFFSWAQSKNFDWYPYKPFWMLYSELTNNLQPIISDRPIKPKMEIFKRLKGDKLSDGQINRLVEKALELQADRNISWDGYWGEIVEDAWYMGKATDDQLQQYLKTAISNGIHLSTRSIIRQGETVIVDFGYNGRARSRRSSRFVMSTNYGPLQIDNIEILPSLYHDVDIYIWFNNLIRSRNYEVDVPPGRHTMTLKIEFSISPFDKDEATKFSHMSYQERLGFAEKNKILEWHDTISIPVEVVEPDKPIIELVDAPELKDKIRNALYVEKCKLKTNRLWFTPYLRANDYKLPMSVAFKVFWRVKDKEWLVNNFIALKSPFTYSNDNASIYLEDFPLDATHVDVILRSSAELAEKYNACTRIWQGEIVIPDQRLIIFEDKK